MKVPCKTALYVDGFNFYYGVTSYFRREREQRGYSLSGLCWTDFRALAERHLMKPGQSLARLAYFTAPVTPAVETSERPGETSRYGLWMKALRTIPGVEVIQGFHKPHGAEPGHAAKARDEKQTDVNLAVELLLDAANNVFEQAFVLSGDSDQIPAIIAAAYRIGNGRRVRVLIPPGQDAEDWKKRYAPAAYALRQRGIEFKSLGPNQVDVQTLTEAQLANSLLPYVLPEVECPDYWRLKDSYLERMCRAECDPRRQRAS